MNGLVYLHKYFLGHIFSILGVLHYANGGIIDHILPCFHYLPECSLVALF